MEFQGEGGSSVLSDVGLREGDGSAKGVGCIVATLDEDVAGLDEMQDGSRL